MPRFQRFILYLTAGLLMFSATRSIRAEAINLYVSVKGSDTNSGDASNPFATIAAARDAARQYASKEPVTIHVADGIYYLPETLVLTPTDSGSTTCPVVYRAQNEGGAVLSGGSELKLSWEPHKDGIFKAQTRAGLKACDPRCYSLNGGVGRHG